MTDADLQLAAESLKLQQLIHDYCFELDLTGGLDAHRFFTEDGRLEVGKMSIDGHEQMKTFYKNFVDQVKETEPSGQRTTRHVVANLRISFQGADAAQLDFIAMNYSSGGSAPIFGTIAPTIISDACCKCRRGADGQWLIHEFTGAPIFMGDDPLQQKTLTE
ncbi:nuclear transport factor 2 family protein [Pseudomaricurvus sp. HS19]|uniref:nuclear transport factor 2 family protein n=1 Tax=Pseudomaricurvus sp. HS19 TaxID=2692626 RepID=UPI001367C3F7|nr:nuclear transport factor 2 family protein [Pseudomaricurvus sp. HS19]MYM61927.1 hypothetical protein [Pseudomaricurvus sp. HS19]